jgi:hypothetical protein
MNTPTLLAQLKEAERTRLLLLVQVWGDSIFVCLNLKREQNQKDRLLAYFQQLSIPVEHLTNDSFLLIPRRGIHIEQQQ